MCVHVTAHECSLTPRHCAELQGGKCLLLISRSRPLWPSLCYTVHKSGIARDQCGESVFISMYPRTPTADTSIDCYTTPVAHTLAWLSHTLSDENFVFGLRWNLVYRNASII